LWLRESQSIIDVREGWASGGNPQAQPTEDQENMERVPSATSPRAHMGGFRIADGDDIGQKMNAGKTVVYESLVKRFIFLLKTQTACH
jgi:hypothetical protein